jgi:hypothetical protein
MWQACRSLQVFFTCFTSTKGGLYLLYYADVAGLPFVAGVNHN